MVGYLVVRRFPNSAENGFLEEQMGCAAPNSLHWEDLRSRPPEQILGQDGVRLNPEGRGYEVAFLNALYHVDPVAERIVELAPNPLRVMSEEFQILLIRYLVAENGGPIDGIDVSEKDLPGGVTFFQGPHALHVVPIAKAYGDDPEAFAARGSELGAEPRQYGDKAMRFFPFPKISVTYVLWRGDEEFPASVSVIFDKSITRWFQLDMIFTTVMVITERIVRG
ncbi:MAG: DUF3786 domain-containing protein [Desulfomonile tiedjei]|uniref:DUF3786 domain-containing protein n=1 Tax=Desulfomonile tiedjei TaxID=2358 RepID=A0A9D6Z3P6_9BACT|nr:DUF3786 domain-containing protein [Desulfomonile tiedjei]